MSDNLQASIAAASIKVDGKSLALAERDLEEIIVDTGQNLPAMATIRLHDPKSQWTEGNTFQIGKPLELTLAPSRSMQKVEAAVVFEGEIISVEPSFNALGTSALTIRAYDKSHRLHIGTYTKTYLNQTDSGIVNEIAKRYQLKAGTLTTTSPTFEYVLQNNLSDFEFLQVRAKRSGCILSVVGDTINFARPHELFVNGPAFDIGESLREFSVRASGTQQSTEIFATGWDYMTKKEISETMSEPPVKWSSTGLAKVGSRATNVFGKKKLWLTTFAPATSDEAKGIAVSSINDQHARYIEADGITYGHPQLVAGKIINLTNLGKRYSGLYFVTSATHIYNSAGYEVHFTVAGRFSQTINQLLNPSSSGEREPGSIMNVVIGIVTNNKDPKDLGRIKVKFPWMPKLMVLRQKVTGHELPRLAVESIAAFSGCQR